jgi:hypothetical protein
MASQTYFMQSSPFFLEPYMRIAIVAVEGSLLSAIAGLSDLFWITNQALRAPPEGMEQGGRFRLDWHSKPVSLVPMDSLYVIHRVA